jgi:hypothetical protein
MWKGLNMTEGRPRMTSCACQASPRKTRDWKGAYSKSYLHQIAYPLHMERSTHRLYLVDWTLLPRFLCTGIDRFSFNTTDEAQVFSDLLVSRIRTALVRAPEVNESSEKIAEFISRLNVEMMGEYHRLSLYQSGLSFQLGPSS